MSADVAYVDSSAFVKLVVTEPETAALRRDLSKWTRLTSSVLLVGEVMRAVLRTAPTSMQVASGLLASVDLVGVTRARVQQAGQLQPPQLRTVDALHLVSALAVGGRLGALVTYDERMAAAAQWYGLPVVTPT
ncbi:MAG: type II toxin-antitoxin system VapC family toxin [Candidatus Dormibacteraeota bacterium]|nr:type II toxin-antitoxin system VapC family toxin [Candidatus Dormibacteraeota bacterium]